MFSLVAYQADAWWVQRLRASTDAILDQDVVAPSNGARPPARGWVEGLRQETQDSLAALDVDERPGEEELELPALAVALLEGEPAALQEVQPSPGDQAGAAGAQWVARLRAEVAGDLAETRHPAEPAPQEPEPWDGEQAAEPLIEWSAEVAPEAREESPAPVEGLPRARLLWDEGQAEEALTVAHDLFTSGEIEGEVLRAALENWSMGGRAPARLYQILGDLHRRAGRLQDAVVAYREAITRL
jgi:hypothetical protein